MWVVNADHRGRTNWSHLCPAIITPFPSSLDSFRTVKQVCLSCSLEDIDNYTCPKAVRSLVWRSMTPQCIMYQSMVYRPIVADAILLTPLTGDHNVAHDMEIIASHMWARIYYNFLLTNECTAEKPMAFPCMATTTMYTMYLLRTGTSVLVFIILNFLRLSNWNANRWLLNHQLTAFGLKILSANTLLVCRTALSPKTIFNQQNASGCNVGSFGSGTTGFTVQNVTYNNVSLVSSLHVCLTVVINLGLVW